MLSRFFVSLTITISFLTTVTSICPNGWTRWDDSCYMLYPGKTTWLDAASLCREFGGHLATLDTAGKIINAKSFLHDANHGVSVWVGANDIRSESMWKWDITQASFGSVTDWATGEPDHGSDENCLILLAHNDYQWADAPCTNTYDYLCERTSTPA